MDAGVAECLQAAARHVEARIGPVPPLALVLGSGLGGFVEEGQELAAVECADIPGYPRATVPGHRGRLLRLVCDGVPVLVMQGRVHYYEGHDAAAVAMPVRLLRLLGVRGVLLTNSAGAINPDFAVGDFMLVTDHIASLVPSPLRGPNLDFLGGRFPDMSAVYDPVLGELLRGVARRAGIPLREGVYVQTPGPNFETPAEIRAYRSWGADAVGMSTACEAVAARHAGLRVGAISCMANLAAGMSAEPLTFAEVEETADRVAPLFRRLLRQAVPVLTAELGAADAGRSVG